MVKLFCLFSAVSINLEVIAIVCNHGYLLFLKLATWRNFNKFQHKMPESRISLYKGTERRSNITFVKFTFNKQMHISKTDKLEPVLSSKFRAISLYLLRAFITLKSLCALPAYIFYVRQLHITAVVCLPPFLQNLAGHYEFDDIHIQHINCKWCCLCFAGFNQKTKTWANWIQLHSPIEFSTSFMKVFIFSFSL